MRSRALLVLLALALGLLAYATALDPERQLAGRDLFHLFYPLGKVVALATRAGSLVPPPRDLTRGMGVALVADPLAWSFYPPRLLQAVLPFDLGFKLVLLLHGSLAGLGAARLARALGASRRASVLAVAATVLSGPILSLHRHPNLLAGVAWAGFALAFTIEAVSSGHGVRERRGIALAGICVGLTLLAGGMEIVLGLAPALVLAAIVCAKDRTAATAVARSLVAARALVLATVALGLGVLLAGVQLAPMWAWIPSTVRPGTVELSEALVWSLPAERLRSLALPPVPALGLWLDRGEWIYGLESFSPSVYLGLVVVALAGVGAVVGDRRARVVAVASAFLVLLALGPWGHVLPLLHHLPVFDRFRYPEKFLILVAVLVPALAARGLDAVLGRRGGAPIALALLVLATLDLAVVNARPSRRLLPTVPTAWLHEPPATVALVGSGRILAGPMAEVPPRAAGHETEEQGFLRTKARHRDILIGGLAGLYGLEDASVYGPFAPRALSDMISATGADQYFLGVTGTTGLIENTSAYPDLGPDALAFPVRNPDRLAPQELPLERVPGSDLAVVHAPGGPRAVFVPARLAMEAPSRERLMCPAAAVVERDGWHVVVQLSAPERGLVVLSELYLDGVTALVDGVPAEVRFSDCALVSIPVGPGPHRVVVEWSVPGLPQGVVATLAGLLLAAWLFFRRAG